MLRTMHCPQGELILNCLMQFKKLEFTVMKLIGSGCNSKYGCTKSSCSIGTDIPGSLPDASSLAMAKLPTINLQYP